MDRIEDADLAAALDQACAAAARDDFQSVVSVASELRDQANGDDDPIRALVAGLEYHLVVYDEQRNGAGPFGPMFEGGGRTYPAPLSEIDRIVPGIYELWERALQLAPLALVRARFADLLWEARYGEQPYLFAGLAADAYTEGSGGSFGHPVERSEAIQRAIEIGSQINDQQRRARAVDAAVALTEEALASDEPMAGVALPLLERFVEDSPQRRPSELDRLLDAAVERFKDDPWSSESALDLKAKSAPPQVREGLFTSQAEAFRDVAHRSTGLVKYAHLQHAIELAEAHDLRALADDIRREVEAMSVDELELQEVRAEVTVPRADVDAFVGFFIGNDNMNAALARFGAYVPSGDPDENKKYVEKLMAEHPIQYLATHIRIGPENSLVRTTQGAADQAQQALIDHEAQSASMFSLFAVDILKGIKDRYGPIADARDFFETDLIDSMVAARIVHAVRLYESDDFDAAGSVLAPRLERVVRKIAASVGLTVTKSPDGRVRAGGVKGLGELLGKLEGAMPESSRHYLRVLLSEVTGLNLRNRIGHGLDDETLQREAALLIHAACHLALMAPETTPPAEDAPDSERGR